MKFSESEFIWFNGKLVPFAEAKVHVLSHVIHYGSGVFEGIRAYATPNGPAILGLAPHVARFFASCKIIELPLELSHDDLTGAIKLVVDKNGHESCYIRPVAFRGYGAIGIDPRENPVDVAIATVEWGALMGQEALERGVDVGVSSWRRPAASTQPVLAKASANYLNSQLVLLEAKRHGYAEGLVLDVDGFVAEGSGENVFLVTGGQLNTPPLDSSILPGITRSFIMQLAADRGLSVIERRIPREMLYVADEVFMTGTAAEVTPIKSVDGKSIGTGTRGPLTAELQREFFGILRGEIEDRHSWLTLVRP